MISSSLLGSTEAPLHIGYTSGKGWDDPAIADLLIENGLTEISFTVFATDLKLRKKDMHDPTPEASLAILERLCGAADVYAAAVVLPGVNDGKVTGGDLQVAPGPGGKGPDPDAVCEQRRPGAHPRERPGHE